MRLESAQELKQRLLTDIIIPLAAHATRVRVAGARAVATAAVAGAEPLAVFGVGARPFDKVPQIQRSVALGVARHQGEYRLAVRVQRPALLHSPMLEHVRLQAKGEVEIRVVGRIDKRATRVRAATAATAHAATPCLLQQDCTGILVLDHCAKRPVTCPALSRQLFQASKRQWQPCLDQGRRPRGVRARRRLP